MEQNTQLLPSWRVRGPQQADQRRRLRANGARGDCRTPRQRDEFTAVGWSEAQKKAYAIADNKLTLNGGWDEELLGLELGELEVLGFDLDLVGFSEVERAVLAAQFTVGLTDPDEVPELPEVPASQRVTCGNSGATGSCAVTVPTRLTSSRCSEPSVRT